MIAHLLGWERRQWSARTTQREIGGARGGEVRRLEHSTEWRTIDDSRLPRPFAVRRDPNQPGLPLPTPSSATTTLLRGGTLLSPADEPEARCSRPSVLPRRIGACGRTVTVSTTRVTLPPSGVNLTCGGVARRRKSR